MIEQKIQQSTAMMTDKTNATPEFPTVTKRTAPTGIDQWLRATDKWLKILATWKKESYLLQNLVKLSTTGQTKKMERLGTLNEQIQHLMIEVKQFEKDLVNFQEHTPMMHRNQLYYESKHRTHKDHIKDLSHRYIQIKNQLLEELAMSYPVTIF